MNTTQKQPPKKKKPAAKKKTVKRRKINAKNMATIIVSVIVVLGLIGGSAGMVMIGSMIKDAPKIDINNFESKESTQILDKDGNLIQDIGQQIRTNVSYEDMPTSLVDAFVAVEDSRYFEHNGFDLPRFAKAFLTNLKTLSFSQGGSTFTMQLVKNTYFTNDETYYVDAAKMIRQYRLAERKSLPYSWFVQEGILIPYSLTPPVHYLRVIDELYFKEK